MLLDKSEYESPFEEGEVLWSCLKKVVNYSDVEAAREQVTRFRTAHPLPLLDEEEVLPDEGEDLPDGPPESHPVALKARTSRELQAVRDAVTVAASNARIGGAADFRRLCQDLADTEYTGVSMQAFLWLVGYCNTGASYEQASKDYAKPLACAMFGYVPEEVFTSSGWNVKLKTFRWGTRMPPDLEEAILASHRGRAGI